MAKTNFTKAEIALSEAMQKMARDQLLEEADAAKGIIKSKSPEGEMRVRLALTIKRHLKRLQKEDPEIYKKLGIGKKSLLKSLEEVASMPSEQFNEIKKIHSKVETYIKALPETSVDNEKMVEGERHKHINKRFNVSDKWLPLT